MVVNCGEFILSKCLKCSHFEMRAAEQVHSEHFKEVFGVRILKSHLMDYLAYII